MSLDLEPGRWRTVRVERARAPESGARGEIDRRAGFSSPRICSGHDQHDSTTTNPDGRRPAGFTLTYSPSSANAAPSSAANMAAYNQAATPIKRQESAE